MQPRSQARRVRVSLAAIDATPHDGCPPSAAAMPVTKRQALAPNRINLGNRFPALSAMRGGFLRTANHFPLVGHRVPSDAFGATGGAVVRSGGWTNPTPWVDTRNRDTSAIDRMR